MIMSWGCNEPLRVETRPSLSSYPGIGSRDSLVSAVTVLSHVELFFSTYDRVHIVAWPCTSLISIRIPLKLSVKLSVKTLLSSCPSAQP